MRQARRYWPAFQRLWQAHAISTFGDKLTLVALPLAAYAETKSALAVGIVASAEGATAILVGLPAGALADRLPYRRVLVLTDLGRMVILIALIASTVGPGGSIVALLAAAIGLGVVRVVHDAAHNAALPLVVANDDLLAANGRMQAVDAGMTAIGPVVAGALIAVGGTALAFGTDAGTFAIAGALVSTLRPLDDAPPPEGDVVAGWFGRLRHDIADGVRHLWADRPMRRIAGMVAAMNLVAVSVEAQFIPYAREVLEIGPLGIGAYFALGGTVAVTVSLLAGRSVVASGRAVTVGLAVFSGGVAIAGIWPSFASVALAYTCAGAGSALVTTHLATFRQRRFPIRLQGRVSMSMRALILAPMPVGFVLGGWLSVRSGPELLFTISGVIGLVVASWGVLSGTSRLRVS